MAKLNVVKDPNPILRKRSKDVTDFGVRLHQLLDDMHDTMRANPAVGIAAVQVGILWRVCLVDTDGDGIVELVNPSLLKSSGKKIGDEGCLSVEGRRGNVARAQRVTVRARDRNGKFFEREFYGRDAVVVCHELDHLDGILFTDKVAQ